MISLLLTALVAILLSQYKCAMCPSDPGYAGSSSNYCHSMDLGTFYRCCYLYFKIGDVEAEYCVGLSEAQYKNIKKTIQDRFGQTEEKADEFSLDCSSNYTIISMFSIPCQSACDTV